MRTRSVSWRSLFVAALAFSFALVSLPLKAEDLAFHEVGARAAALGGAFTGKADDITAIFYNPAGLAFLRGVSLKTNLLVDYRTVSAYSPEFATTFKSSPREYLQNIFVAWQPVKRIGLGLGYFSPFGFETQWGSGSWAWREVNFASWLRSYCLRSVLSVEVVDGLALSAALDIVSTSVRWHHSIPFELGNYTLPSKTLTFSHQELKGHGVGFTASALWKVIPALQIGARYQKSAAVDLAGRNTFSNSIEYQYDSVPDPILAYRTVGSLLDMFFVTQPVTGRVTLPQELACGIALTPIPKLSLYLDVVWDRWSEFGSWEFRSVNTNDTLAPGFTPLYQEFWGVTPNYGVQSTPLVLQDTRKFKAGVEFRPSRLFAVRAGFAHHESSVKSADLSPLYPDAGRNFFSAGGGYDGPIFSPYEEDTPIGYLAFDLFIRLSSADKAPSTFPGLEMTYGGTRWDAGVGVGFRF